jgi:DNA-binding NarL/FixJ family response regulator
MKEDESVILVGLKRHPKALELANRLRVHGFEIIEAPTPKELPAILRRFPRVAVVVYSPTGDGTARETVEAVRGSIRGAPVVVLVDHSDFSDYYELMSAGALEYYALSESSEVIERGVGWAVRTHAA